MRDSESPFRLLVKTYASRMLTRDQYVKIRGQLLKKLQGNGEVTKDDLNHFTDISFGNPPPEKDKPYSLSDWIIVALGLIAVIVLVLVI
ncbi:MAG: hypothetical protein OEY09_01530 [Gammaproteobacteria bacterium]|nr:hypothetical protein [Gammaproteobacteria bacterium]